MAFIPEDAKWYLAEIVLEITVQDEPESIVHINLTLVEASLPEAAYERAMELGKDSEVVDENLEGKIVTTIFRGLNNLHVIHEELAHGSELLYSEMIGLSESEVSKLVKAKNELNVFKD